MKPVQKWFYLKLLYKPNKLRGHSHNTGLCTRQNFGSFDLSLQVEQFDAVVVSNSFIIDIAHLEKELI
jgi:hypothetical protein